MAALNPAAAPRFDFGGGEAILECLVYFVQKSGFHFGNVLRRGDRRDLERAAFLTMLGIQVRRDTVTEAIVDADASGEARIEKAATKQKVSQHQRRVIGVLIANIQTDTGGQRGVLFIRRFDGLVDGGSASKPGL